MNGRTLEPLRHHIPFGRPLAAGGWLGVFYTGEIGLQDGDKITVAAQSTDLSKTDDGYIWRGVIDETGEVLRRLGEVAPLKAIVGAMVDLLTDPTRNQRKDGDPLHLGAWEARRLDALRADIR